MGYGCINVLSIADKERHVEKVSNFIKRSMKTHSILPKTEIYPYVCPAVRSFAEFVPFIRCWFVGLIRSSFPRGNAEKQHANSPAGIILLNIYIHLLKQNRVLYTFSWVSLG